MKFTCPNHQNKAVGLIAALIEQGHEFVPGGMPADVLLIDHDIMDYHRAPIDAYKAQGAKVLLYPHGANPNLQWDGLHEPYCNVDAFISPNEGHKAIMETYGYPKPIHVVGWWLSEQREFEPTPGKDILFAPIHPDGNDELPNHETDANRDMFAQLLRMKRDGEIDSLTVRYLGSLSANGLWIEDNVTYKTGVYDNSYRDILVADCVVTSGTYGYLTVAMGKPVVMYFQGLGTAEKNGQEPKHYVMYEDLLHYPIDPERLKAPLSDLIPMACAQDRGIAWRALFIGEALDAAGVKIIEDVVDGS